MTLDTFVMSLASKGIPSLGKPRLVSMLADSHHSSARILTVRVKNDDSVSVLKQVKTRDGALFARVTKNQTNTVIAGQSKNEIIEITDDDEVQDGFMLIPFEFCVEPMVLTDGATKLLQCSEFILESTVDFLIKKYVVEKVPYFLTSKCVWRSKRHGNILLRNAGFEMTSHFPFYSLDQVKAIVLQVMYAVAWGQHYIHLKHHDLHCGNVFVDGVTEQSSLKFPSTLSTKSKSRSYNLVGGMPKILIADYGLSAATDPKSKQRVMRADLHLMETKSSRSSSNNEKSEKCSCCSSSTSSKHSKHSKSKSTQSSSSSLEGILNESRKSTDTKSDDRKSDDDMDYESEDENDWGEWTHELSEKHTGYDIACFISHLCEEAEDRKHESFEWLESVIQCMEDIDPEFELTSRGRPRSSSAFTVQELASVIF